MLCVKQVFPELVAQVHIYFFESAFAVNEVVEVLIDKSPFLVVLAELLLVILQKVRFVLAFVEESMVRSQSRKKNERDTLLRDCRLIPSL